MKTLFLFVQRNPRFIAFVCTIFLLGVGSSAAQGDTYDRINRLRGSLGLPGYALNGALSAAAQSQAQWLVDNGCAIAHTHPDGSSPRTRAAAAGYPSSDVSENIYCGTIATPNDAWTFWMNSAIHYAGITNGRYQEVGIGTASGAAGNSYVLVFGAQGSGVVQPTAPPGSGSSGGGASGTRKPSGPPAYVLGTDAHGNIRHQIQDSQTLGDILLIYGYTWDDIPAILELNQMTQDDVRKLKVGSELLIPPKAGTYTPTASGPTETPTLTPPPIQPSSTAPATAIFVTAQAVLPTQTSPSPPTLVGATLNALPAEVMAMLATPTATLNAQVQATTAQKNNTPLGYYFLAAAVLVQAGVLVGIGTVYLWRRRKRSLR